MAKHFAWRSKRPLSPADAYQQWEMDRDDRCDDLAIETPATTQSFSEKHVTKRIQRTLPFPEEEAKASPPSLQR